LGPSKPDGELVVFFNAPMKWLFWFFMRESREGGSIAIAQKVLRISANEPMQEVKGILAI
jgi:hypothetical protein